MVMPCPVQLLKLSKIKMDVKTQLFNRTSHLHSEATSDHGHCTPQGGSGAFPAAHL